MCKGLNVKYFLVLFLVSLTWSSAKQEIYKLTQELLKETPQGQTIAVLPFESQITDEPKAGYSIAEIIANSTISQGYPLVERMQLNQILSEQALSGSGAIEEDQALEIGQLLSAKLIITGSVTSFMGERMVNVKLLDATTSQVLNSKSLTIGLEEFSGIQKELLGESIQKSAVLFRSALVPGWGQMYANKSVRGGIWLISFLITGGAGAYLSFDAVSKHDTYQSTIDGYKSIPYTESQREKFCPETCDQGTFNTLKQEHIDQKWNDYEDALNLSYYAWGAAGVVWTMNLVDAYFVANERVKKFEPYFAVVPTLEGDVQLAMSFRF